MACPAMCMKVRGELSVVGSLLPCCGSWEMNSGHQLNDKRSCPRAVSPTPLPTYSEDNSF